MASRRDRLRAAQLAQLDAQAALAEVEKVLPKRKKPSQEAVPPIREPAAPKALMPKRAREKPPARAKGLNRRLAFRAAQQAQLEAPPALGEADMALLAFPRRRKAREREATGPRALRRKARFQSLWLAQLETGPVLAVVERELLSLPKGRGKLAALSVALARLRRVRLTGDGWKGWGREAKLEGLKEALVVEEAAPEMAKVLERPSQGIQIAESLPPAKGTPTAAPVTATPGLVSDGLKKVTTLTAALEEMGVDRENFGFTVTFGSLVSEEDHDSVFSVSGVGLAELSHHLAKWFEQVGRSDFPLQVIDEGSGELKIFISER